MGTNVLTGVTIGVVVAVFASYGVGFLRELGRQGAARVESKRQDDHRREDAATAATVAVASRESADQAKRQQMDRLMDERVGVRFIRREARDDPGLPATVLRLDDRFPLDRVIVRYEPGPGREPTPHDPPVDTESVDWAIWTAPAAEQRHRVARLIEHSIDDGVGWVQYERAVQ